MILLGILKDADGKTKSGIFNSWKEWHSFTFSPATEIQAYLLLKTEGKTYEERKENLKGLAIDFQLYFNNISWSYGELAEINNFFYKNGKRYGLLKEFQENAIC